MLRHKVVLMAALLWSGSSLQGEQPEERLLCGFEIGEMRPPDTNTRQYFVGKEWTSGKEPPPGWRFRKATEYRLDPGYRGHVTIYQTGSSRDYAGRKLFYTEDSQGRYSLCRRLAGKVDFMSWPGAAA